VSGEFDAIACPSFFSMFERWWSTVFGLITSSFAIDCEVYPSATSFKTSLTRKSVCLGGSYRPCGTFNFRLERNGDA